MWRVMAAVLLAAGWLGSGVTPAGAQPVVPRDGRLEAEPVPNRYLAFGDSITYGHVDMTAYPVRLEAMLDLRVAPSEVINAGKPGEGTAGGRERIVGQVTTWAPSYVLILEGANDVTSGKPPADVYENLGGMIDNARRAGGDGVQIMLATLIPRLDDLNDETNTVNQEAVWPVADDRHVPVCDLWQAFVSRPSWRGLFHDDVHPNDNGFQLMADTFYGCLLASFPEIREDSVPPLAWVEPLPAQSECGQVAVSWNGSDDLSWVVDYDVQAQVDDGPWTDWLLATTERSGVYGGGRYGDRLGFRVRARDLLGNQGNYGDPAYTLVADSEPPYEAHVRPLPAFGVAPLALSWWASDRCADLAAYDVQVRLGVAGAWQDWLLATPATGGSYDPPDPQYGSAYYFRLRAQDAAGNWGAWSDAEASITLARYSASGAVHNVRHQPVAGAGVSLDPAPLWIGRQPGGFLAYTLASQFDITIARDDLYGPLPPMYGLPRNGRADNLEFVLPPRGDAVTGGGFEPGDLAHWQAGGTLSPTLVITAHTGLGAVQLGGAAGDSHLAQTVSLPAAPADPVLSLMVRLARPGPAGALTIELAGVGAPSTPATYDLPVESDGWRHAWYELPGWDGGPLTLTLTVSGSPSIVVDEVSLGSALRGGYLVYAPAVYRRQ